MYDKNNIFSKILRKEIPAKIVYEDDVCLAFYDINPVCKIHVLVITKGEYVNFSDFVNNESSENVCKFFQSVSTIAKNLGIENSGYRIQTNTGPDAGQEVEHFHVHLMGGERL